MCKRLAEKCTSEMDIAALSPYEAQCLEIGKHLRDFPNVAISSVNSAQGNCFILWYILRGCVNMSTYLVSSIAYTGIRRGLAHTCAIARGSLCACRLTHTCLVHVSIPKMKFKLSQIEHSSETDATLGFIA